MQEDAFNIAVCKIAVILFGSQNIICVQWLCLIKIIYHVSNWIVKKIQNFIKGN